MAKSKHFPGKDVYIHTLSRDRRLGFGDERWVRKNRWIHARNSLAEGYPKVTAPAHCHAGMHACRTARGVAKWGAIHVGRIVCVVELRGAVSKPMEGKIVAEERKVLALRRIKNRTEASNIRSFTNLNQYIDWVMENPS